MGDWAIFVQGAGIHHNKGQKQDANRMSAEFVQSLKAAGHTVRFASFTHSGNDNIGDPEKYLENLDKIYG